MESIITRAKRKTIKTLFAANSAIWFKRDINSSLKKETTEIAIRVDFANKYIDKWLEEHHAQFSWLYIPKELACAKKNCHVFATLLSNSDIIGYIKIAFNNAYILDFDEIIELPSDVAFIYDTFLLPNYRGKNIIPSVFEEINIFIKENGAKNIYCHIPSWNTASIKLYNKLGFQNVSAITYFRILKFKFILKNRWLTTTKTKDIFNEF